MSQNQMEETKVEENMEDITGVTCIYIPVSDVYKSVQWYQKNLGCEPTDNNPVEPGMEISILRFPDHTGKPHEAAGRVPAIFLMGGEGAAGSYGFTYDNGYQQPAACFITPRIQEMYKRFKENGVNIVTEIPENRPCGPNFIFGDPDGNLFEIWEDGADNKQAEDITGVACIYIPVKDVYESVKWYQKHLGCEPTDNNPVKPGMEISILRFRDYPGKPFRPTGGVPSIFLMGGEGAAGSYGFTYDNGYRQPAACFITPHIQEMYKRFKENGVNIVTEIPENRPCGPNFTFGDPDGNLLEIWQP